MPIPNNRTIQHSLSTARDAALEVHRALLERTRLEYEREFGRVQDATTLLTLVTSEPAFAWLRPLTAAIADADEVLAAPHDVDPSHARVLLRAIHDLLRADAAGSPFQRRYHEAIQASPDVAVVHGRAASRVRMDGVKWT